jgi:4-hydroxyproline epimerase
MNIHVIDSHTGGEPTRVVVGGWPEPLGETAAEKRDWMLREQDHLRKSVVCEPRGNDVIVGALLTESQDDTCVCGVVFFNNVGYLGMCGHGTIGVIETLKYLGRIDVGVHRIETPVGVVEATLLKSGEVEIQNVPSMRREANKVIRTSIGEVRGEVAWGGNWFFLVHRTANMPALEVANAAELIRLTEEFRDAINAEAPDGYLVDHVELFDDSATADSRNFVLCPGSAYDRSPCGTGTSAKLACLFAEGKLEVGQKWVQESITGSKFTGWVTLDEDGRVIPHIAGRAHVCGESKLIFDESDPFCWGIS